MPQPDKLASTPSLRALDTLNFFLADVRDGLGPYLAIYLLATHHWDAASIGIAMSAMGIATVVAQTPAGALIDKLRQKRLLIVIACALVALACVAMTFWVNLPAIITAQAVVGIAAAIFPPAVAAISLGLVGPRHFSPRIGRNEAFNHAGNVTAAVLAGLIGHFIAREGIFYLVAVMAIVSIVSVLFIKEQDIDHRLARGAKSEADAAEENVSGFAALIKDRRVLIFALTVTLFHFANAAMLPLAGQLLSLGKATGASLYMSACIITAQLVMIPVAVFAGTFAERWGRRPIFLIAFAVLPVRGLLYTLSDNPFFIVAVQLLDGVAAGIFGVVAILMVADLTRGTGRFNITQGAIATALGIGASLSNLMAGYIVNAAGYDVAFLTLAGIAALALAIFYFAMPETQQMKDAGDRHATPGVSTVE